MTGSNGSVVDVVELDVVDEDGAVAAFDDVAGPGRDAQHEHAVVGIAVGDDGAVVGLRCMHGDDVAGARDRQNR